MTTASVTRMPEPEHGHTEAVPHHEIPYMMIFGALLGLTVITVLAAQKRFEPEVINVLIALAIASVKASLVALYFMHLKFEGKLIYTMVIVPVCLCVLLVTALIPDIIMTDPIKHPNSTSLKLFNPVMLLPSAQEEGHGGESHAGASGNTSTQSKQSEGSHTEPAAPASHK